MPYTIIEGSELYTDDDFEEEDPDLRQIIDNRLIIKGRDKYLRAYVTQLEQGEKEWFLPDSREDMLRFEEDQFYLTPEGRKMADFVGSLRTSGQYSGWARGKEGAILDLEGNPVKGKKLSEFSFMTEWIP